MKVKSTEHFDGYLPLKLTISFLFFKGDAQFSQEILTLNQKPQFKGFFLLEKGWPSRIKHITFKKKKIPLIPSQVPLSSLARPFPSRILFLAADSHKPFSKLGTRHWFSLCHKSAYIAPGVLKGSARKIYRARQQASGITAQFQHQDQVVLHLMPFHWIFDWLITLRMSAGIRKCWCCDC